MDERLRELERRWSRTGDPADEQELIRARLQVEPPCDRCIGSGAAKGVFAFACGWCGGARSLARGRLRTAALLGIAEALPHVQDDLLVVSTRARVASVDPNARALGRDILHAFESGGGRVGVLASEVAAHALRLRACDEDVACPWPIRIEAHGYSAHVVIGCPKGTPVTWPGSDKSESEDDDG